MSAIHKPVPHYAAISDMVSDLFSNITPKSPVWRANWALFANMKEDELFSPFAPAPPLSATPFTAKDIVYRSEYQTLVRLPRSEAILFGIRTYQHSIERFANAQPEDIRALARAIQNIPSMAVEYKESRVWGGVAIRYLHDLLLERDSAARL